MRMRPTGFGSSIRFSTVTWLAGIVAVASLAVTPPAEAAWEGSTAERVLSSGLDMLVVRPLAAVRAGVGTALMVPLLLLIGAPGVAWGLAAAEIAVLGVQLWKLAPRLRPALTVGS